MVGLAKHLTHFHMKFTESNNTEAQMLDSIYHVTQPQILYNDSQQKPWCASYFKF